jgi:hypothetical protein
MNKVLCKDCNKDFSNDLNGVMYEWLNDNYICHSCLDKERNHFDVERVMKAYMKSFNSICEECGDLCPDYNGHRLKQCICKKWICYDCLDENDSLRKGIKTDTCPYCINSDRIDTKEKRTKLIRYTFNEKTNSLTIINN